MESPVSWNLLTASLAVCDLGAPFSAWAFLVLQGLVRDMPGDRESFAAFVAEAVRWEREHGPATGFSLARRAADSLKAAGVTHPPSEAPDPCGEIAISRLSGISSWGNRDFDRDHLEQLREGFKPFKGEPATVNRATPMSTKPWWRLW